MRAGENRGQAAQAPPGACVGCARRKRPQPRRNPTLIRALNPPFFPFSRAAQAAEKGGDEKESVKAYFNEVGFERWSRIYSDTDDVNKVQLDIRTGHAQTVDKVLAWIGDSVKGVTVCDAGCGTGSLSIPLALRVSWLRKKRGIDIFPLFVPPVI